MNRFPEGPPPADDALARANSICKRLVNQAQENVDDVLAVLHGNRPGGASLTPPSYETFARRWAGLTDVLLDPRTGLANRLLFWDRLRHAVTRRHRYGTGAAVLYVCTSDADELHVPQLAARLGEGLRGTDTISYAGNGEFTILLDPVEAPVDAVGVARRIHQALVAPLEMAAVKVGVSANVGVVYVGAQHAAPETVLWDAYAAVQQGRSLGWGRVEVAGGEGAAAAGAGAPR
jgi:GGDEF domain-containing protein